MKEDNSTSVVIGLLKKLKVNVTASSITDELEKHPSHPSLFAINDVLNLWQVPNEAFRVDYEALNEIPVPYLAHLRSGGGEFVVVNQTDDENIYVSNEKWNDYKMPRAAFKNQFSGNILIAEADPESGEQNYASKKKEEILNELRYPILIAGALIVLLIAVFQHTSFIANINWQTILLTLFKTAGVLTSVLLLIHSIDSNNTLTERLCTGESNNCNAILSSKAAKVTENLSWSEVGFFYFSGSWLILLFNTNSVSLMQTLAVLSLLCLPYTAYSIYYQHRVAKQWCLFCLTIQTLFWLESFVFFPYLLKPLIIPSFTEWSTFVICFGSPVLLWLFLKPVLLQSMKLAPLKRQLKKFKYNESLFNKSLKEQPKYDLLDESQTIILGNVEAEKVITIVSNPYCQPCSKAHKVLDRWLSEKDNFKLQLVFSTREDSDNKAIVARHLHQLAIESPGIMKNAVHDWYEHKYTDIDVWKQAYPIKREKNIDSVLEKQRSWCKLTDIKGTPTIFLNGHRLPPLWNLEDIKYFI